MKRVYCRAMVALGMVLCASAQQPRSQQPKAPGTQKTEGLTVDGVIAMVQAGLSDDVIVARLHKENKGFDLTPEQLIRLKNAKVTDRVMRFMLDPGADIAAPPPAPLPAPVIPAAPMAVIPAVRTGVASGATPAPGSEVKGDPNDPLNPHDSGIYLISKDREGRVHMVVLERASYQGSKSGGYLGSAMTYGIVKAKTKAILAGPHANIRVNDSSPVFYFYFEDKQAGLGKTYFGVGNLSNPNQFSLMRLEVNKQNRESTVGQFSALGSSSGADTKAMIQFKSERIRAGLYKVTVDNIRAGEYCFVASSHPAIASPYAAMANVTTDIFDFGVSVE